MILIFSYLAAMLSQSSSAKQEKNRIMETSGDNTVRRTQELIDDLSAGPDFIAAFDGDLFDSLVGRVVVEDAEHISFQMKNGLRLNERIERMKR